MLAIKSDLYNGIYVPLYVVDDTTVMDTTGQLWMLEHADNYLTGNSRVYMFTRNDEDIRCLDLKIANKKRLVECKSFRVMFQEHTVLAPICQRLNVAKWLDFAALKHYCELTNNNLLLYIWYDTIIHYVSQ